MTHPGFVGSRAKIKRARRHIDELIAESDNYLKADPPPFISVTGTWPDGRRVHRAKCVRPYSPEFSAIIHDALSNLRHSLDNAVCEAGTLSGATDLRNTYFHVAGSEVEWDKSFKGRTKAAPPAVIAVNRAWMPWADGNELLYALSRLVVADKHQLATPLASVPNAESISIKSIEAPATALFVCHPIGGDPPPNPFNTETMELDLVLEAAGRVEITHMHLSITTAFGPAAGSLVGCPVVPNLHAMADLCDEIVDSIEAAVVAAGG